MITSGGTTTLGLYDFKIGIEQFGQTGYWVQKANGYPINKRIMLTNGDIVKSTIDGNTNNPNVDMTGWELPQARDIFDESGENQQEVNNSITKDSSLYMVSGFPNNNADQVLSFLQFNKMMAKFQPNSEISIEKPIVVDLTGAKSTEIDLQGATLNFKTGGRLTFRGKTTPYLTTTATTDLRRGGTYFQVASVAGIEKGDLIVVKSPVVITTAAKLTQTYIVQGIDVANRYIYVMACIVGDMRADQITAQGLTGNITVECYKVADRIKVTNGKITSLNRDDESTALYFDGFYHIDCTGLTPDKTNRTSISAAFFGFWDIDKCLVIDPGYVENDQGYNSIPSNPSGLGFGYGFLANNGFCARFFNNHVVAGWHGFDAAGGVTFAIAMNNTIYKGAFGISTHEGQWSLIVQGNTVLGGHAVTCRSFELTFKDNIGRGIRSRFIIGSRRMQSLVIDNNDVELSNQRDGNWVYFDGAYPESCFSLDEPVAKVSRNTVRGLSGVSSRLSVWKNLDLLDNDFGFGNNSFITFDALDNTGVLNMGRNKSSGVVQQFPYGISGSFGEVNIFEMDDHTTTTLGGSSLIQFSGALPKVNLINNKVRNKNSTVRNLNNSVINFENVIGNMDFNNVVIDNASNNTVQRYFNNLTKNPIPTNNVVNYVNQRGNLLLDKQYQASKTHDWASVAAGATTSTTITLTGAVLGDAVVASMNIALNGLRPWAEVTATNVVTFYLHNPTAAAVDLPSGTLTVKLI